MYRIILLSLLFISFITSGFTQVKEGTFNKPAVNSTDYTVAIGVRIGGISGITGKLFLDENNAVEGILGAWPGGLSITALYERHLPAFATEGLRWYYGGGGHVHFDGDSYGNPGAFGYREDELGIGVDGVFGIEYKIRRVPLALSFDLVPFVEVISNGNLNGGISPGFEIKVPF